MDSNIYIYNRISGEISEGIITSADEQHGLIFTLDNETYVFDTDGPGVQLLISLDDFCIFAKHLVSLDKNSLRDIQISDKHYKKYISKKINTVLKIEPEGEVSN